MSRGPGRQDYIARVRYQNELPPPPCPPKLLDMPVDVKQVASSSFLSDLARKQPFNMDVDLDLGMPLDMSEVPGIFDRGDETGVYPINSGDVDLDPKDRALLKEPSGGVGGTKSQPSVSFLRRTEYISSEAVKQKGSLESKTTALKKRERHEEVLDPEEQLRVVESTFDAANSDLESVKHPIKKQRKAVDSWPLLPDSKMFDVMHLAVKMVGSASLSNRKTPFSRASLSTALFRQNAVDNDEWMTFYTAEPETAEKLKQKLDNPSAGVDDVADDDNVYRFNRVQDHDIDLHVHESQFEEIAIQFDKDNNQALYIPIVGRTNLKRRRVVKSRRELVNENSVARIDLSLREISAQESVHRDNSRSEYDPVSYTFTDLPEEDDTGNQSDNNDSNNQQQQQQQQQNQSDDDDEDLGEVPED
jgi:RNA polymerase II-associated factor 1